MTDETNGAGQPDAEDTAAVLAAASGDKTYLGEKGETPETETPGDDAAAETDTEAHGEQPKPKKSVQERIDEVTAARREAEREAAFWKAKATQPASQPQPVQPKADAEPDPADYQYGETDPAYTKALGAFAARQEFARLTQERERDQQVRTIEQSWEQRQADFAKTKPDYHDVLARDWTCSVPMADAIRDSAEGAAVAYHLAQHPDEARRIAALNPLAQIREIGRLEASLAKAAEPAAEPTPQPKTVSSAPIPAPQVRGASGQFKVAADTDDFAAFERQYRVGGG